MLGTKMATGERRDVGANGNELIRTSRNFAQCEDSSSGLANMSPREEWQAEDYRALADCRGEGDSPAALST
jgi:hypothetical protein